MSEPIFQNVTVIGAGTMGAGIAQVCAMAGSHVNLYDVSQEFLDRGVATIDRFLDKGVEKGRVTEDERTATKELIKPTLDLTFAGQGVDLVIEAVPEEVELKNGIFKQMAETCGEETVLASNTSSLPLADVFGEISNPERCVGMHFFNPPPIMPLLELIRTETVSLTVLDRIETYSKELGKEPILVKDSPGFAMSRLGVCLGLEAIRMVEDGVAEAEDIDKAMELGYRHPMGPLRLTDLVGLDVRMAIADYLKQELSSPAFEVPALMRAMVEEGKLGKKSGQGFYNWD